MKHTPRKLSADVLFALKNSPVVFVNGPRQSGKSTLVQLLAKKDYPADYISFDNPTQMAAASLAPESFLSERKKSVIIDEVQMVPELFRALKIVVDEQRLENKKQSQGRFLLTGSANIMALPKLSDPLVGRMSVKTLYPFAACEALQGEGDFLSALFAADFSHFKVKHSLSDATSMATFPDICDKPERERREWFDGYLMTLLQRDVHILAEIEKIALLPNLLRMLAVRAGHLINDADIARDLGLNPVTSKSYRILLQAMFLTFDVQPWHRNIGKRLVKASKGYMVDTSMLCHLLDWNMSELKTKRPEIFGHVVENFVATEFVKLLSFSDVRAKLLHFRTSDHKEVDFVLERPDGTLAGVEVKSAEHVNAQDFKDLNILRDVAQKDFVCGVVLYSGKHVVPFGDRLWAVPLAALWM